MVQLNEYDTFRDLGKDAPEPVGHKKIWTHLVYNIKDDRQHKVRLVDYGKFTDIIAESVYSKFVSICVILIIVLINNIN